MQITIPLSLAAFAATVINGHSIFQRLRVNDVDQGQLVGVRAPAVNNPVLTVTAPAIACNTGLNTPISTAVVTIPAGAKVGAWYEHVLGGPQGASDPDNPIASSHKGPLLVYLAKVLFQYPQIDGTREVHFTNRCQVTNAATASWTGLSWFKIAEEGLNTVTGKWGVDSMIAGQGWWNFTMPACIEAGQYLLRVELIALHSAYAVNGAQFYMS